MKTVPVRVMKRFISDMQDLLAELDDATEELDDTSLEAALEAGAYRSDRGASGPVPEAAPVAIPLPESLEVKMAREKKNI